MKTLLIAQTLDALGKALAEHGHNWTYQERSLYEKARREINKQFKKETKVVTVMD